LDAAVSPFPSSVDYVTLWFNLGVLCVDIISMEVPEVAESGKDVVLDCNYHYRYNYLLIEFELRNVNTVI
jgi:hypothetical protein